MWVIFREFPYNNVLFGLVSNNDPLFKVWMEENMKEYEDRCSGS